MSSRWIAALGAAGSFILAAVVGALGNQLGRDSTWAWAGFGVTLVLGAVVTAWMTLRAAKAGGANQPAETVAYVQHVDDVRIGSVSADGGQAVGVNYGDMTQTTSVTDRD